MKLIRKREADVIGERYVNGNATRGKTLYTPIMSGCQENFYPSPSPLQVKPVAVQFQPSIYKRGRRAGDTRG
ncbi:MAG TPA: hypothetical protein VF527_07300, partial [Pyrinomonadaceae bacterium]